jgi:hypothetical protein
VIKNEHNFKTKTKEWIDRLPDNMEDVVNFVVNGDLWERVQELAYFAEKTPYYEQSQRVGAKEKKDVIVHLIMKETDDLKERINLTIIYFMSRLKNLKKVKDGDQLTPIVIVTWFPIIRDFILEYRKSCNL